MYISLHFIYVNSFTYNTSLEIESVMDKFDCRYKMSNKMDQYKRIQFSVLNNQMIQIKTSYNFYLKTCYTKEIPD